MGDDRGVHGPLKYMTVNKKYYGYVSFLWDNIFRK